MEVREKLVRQGTIEEFADHYGLVMEVEERRVPVGSPVRFYAKFSSCEVKDGAILSSQFGNGSTKEEAIADYASNISMQRLVFNASGKDRREINAWRFEP